MGLWIWKRKRGKPSLAELLAWAVFLLFAGGWAMRVTPLARESGMQARTYLPMLAVAGLGTIGSVGGIYYAIFGAGGLAMRKFGGGRKGCRAAGRFLLGALAGCCGAWGAAVVAPLAWRKGDRRGATAAVEGTALFFGIPWVFRFWPAASADVAWGWGLLAAQSVGAGLLLRGLWRLDGRPNVMRGLAWAMVVVGLPSLALWPGWRVEKLSERADAAMATLWEAAGDNARKPLARVVPPVAESEDPVAALDADMLAADAEDWDTFNGAIFCGREGFPNRQLTMAEWTEAETWLARHPTFVAAAEAVSAPGYRSCLPGAAAPADFSLASENGWLEPRLGKSDKMGSGSDFARVLVLRAGVELLRENKAAALADIDRLYGLGRHYLGEPGLVAKMIGDAFGGSAAATVMGQRFDLWDDAELDALVARAEAFRQSVENGWTGAFADEAYCYGETVRKLLKDALSDKSAAVKGVVKYGGVALNSPFIGPFWHWLEYERCVYARELVWLHEALSEALALPPGPERAAALSTIETQAEQREKGLTHLSVLSFPSLKALFHLQTRRENETAILRAAVAVERWRRAHGGTVPESLEALVPDCLGAVPLDAELGAPFLLKAGEEGRSFAILRPEGTPRRFWFAPPPLENDTTPTSSAEAEESPP